MTARRWLVSGRVQGVGFRWFVKREARRLALRGVVRNLADGSVEVVAEGADGALQVLHHTLRHGPIGSRVDRVQELHVPDELTMPDGFETR
jgi:acylphosphatase